MRILFVAAMYPHPGMPYSGTFIQKCVLSLHQQGHDVVGLVPRPFFPIPASLYPRLKTYAQIPKYSEADGFPVYRPNQWQVPLVMVNWQQHEGSHLQMKGLAQRLHKKHKFEAILSFNLLSAGGLAWRLGELLDIPSVGWAFGTDVRPKPDTAAAHSLLESVEKLDLIFYQSSELRDCAASYLPPGKNLDLERHVVLPHGIPTLQRESDSVGSEVRARFGVPEEATLALFLSRVVRDKGIFDLLDAFEIASGKSPDLFLLAVGETPGFDHSDQLRDGLRQRGLEKSVKLVPACTPDEVPGFQAAADIFVFPSHNEGMPNALLEAMYLGTPAIAFDIPPIRDIQSHDACLCVVELGDSTALGEAMVELAQNASLRSQLAERAVDVVKQHYDVATNMKKATELMSRITADGTAEVDR